MVCRINYRPDFAPVVKYASKASKHAELVASLLSALTPDEMIAEFLQLAGKNTKCKNPCVHIILSPAAGERLTDAQWRQLCERTAQEFGMTQWVAFKHNDTSIQHVSLVGSRIGPSGKAWSTSNDRFRMRTICREFEREHGLRPTPERSHDIRINKDEIEKAQRLCQSGTRPTPVPDRLAIAVAAKAALREPTLMDFQECLSRQGITTRWRHDEQGRPIGVSFGRGEACISGTHAGVSAQMLSLHYSDKGTNIHEQTRRATITGRTSTMVGASGGGDLQADTGGPARQYESTGGNTPPTERPSRSPDQFSGADSAPIREVGNLVVRALSGLAVMCEDMARDGDRFNKERTRRPRLLIQFRPRARTIKREIPR